MCVYIYIYIYIHFSRVTNRRSSTKTKLKIMQLNLYLTPISQGTYGTKELQFECKQTHMVESNPIQIIYVAMKGPHEDSFISFHFILLRYICKH